MAHLITRFLVGAATLGALASPALAAVRFGDSSQEGVTAGNTPELLLIIWDPTKEVSYTRDLGIASYAELYGKGDTSKNLFVYGQQDAGYQKIFDPTFLNSDTNFQSFLSKSTSTTNQYWAIVGGGTNLNAGGGPGYTSAYMTANHEAPTGTRDSQYTKLLTWTKSEFDDQISNLGVYMNDMSNQANLDKSNTHGCKTNPCGPTDYAINGSSFDAKGSKAYAGAMFASLAFQSTQAPKVFNQVNKSSWFYYATTSSYDGFGAIVVDEFDNLKHDAYWGLGVDSKGNYILSYTLEAAITPTATAAGALLRLRTDYAASYGQARLISVPNDLALSAAVTAVPEPATWGLMSLGVAVLGLRTRRRA